MAGLGLVLCALSVMAQERPAITGVAFERVYASDAAAAKAFYGGTLGYKAMEPMGVLVYPVNELQWIEVVPHPPAQAGPMQAAVGFTTRDAAGMAAYLSAHGVALAEPLVDGEFAVRDPEGNVIVFVQSAVAGKSAAAGSVAKMVMAAPLSSNATSHRIIHAGFVVRDRAKEDAFYRGVLGFRLYWEGGPKMEDGGKPAWVSVQVPEGTDWLEYMMTDAQHPDAKALGGADHLALGVDSLQPLLLQLQTNGCGHKECTGIAVGLDGKLLMNLRDPDQTRIEFMEFHALLKPCCSAISGGEATEREDR